MLNFFRISTLLFLFMTLTLPSCWLSNPKDNPFNPEEIIITLNKTNTTILPGGTEQLIATITPANATNQDIIWTSSDDIKATVSSSGLITAKEAGTAIITATADGYQTATCDVTVNLRVASWDRTNEPSATTITSNTASIHWAAITDAVKYKLYTWTGTPWSYYGETTDNFIDITDSNLKSLSFKIEAIDEDSNVICFSYFFGGATAGGLSYLTNEVTGIYTDNFDDDIIDSNYGQKNSTQMNESGGYLQLNQNVTDNGPKLYLLYNPQGNRYVKISFKWYQYKNNSYFAGNVCLYPYYNNYRLVCQLNAHNADSYYGGYGSYLMWNAMTASSGYMEKRLLDSTEYFDMWINREIIIDTFTGDMTVKVNGTPFTSQNTIFYTAGGKFFIIFTSDGWYTGHYTRIDDLKIESSDTVYL